jgi:hypothetical protein
MLKQTVLTMTYSRHAETDDFDHNIFQAYWNLLFWPWDITAMLKLTICLILVVLFMIARKLYTSNMMIWWIWFISKYNREMFIKLRHSFMQRARMMGRKDYWYSKWFVSDISVLEAYGTLTILPGDPELNHVSPRLTSLTTRHKTHAQMGDFDHDVFQ